MSRMDEIKRYASAEELYQTGMDYLNGTNGKPAMRDYAIKYLNAAVEKAHPGAKEPLLKLKAQGVDIGDDWG